MENKKISPIAKIFGLSIWMVLFAWEGSFSMQCIIPFLIILILYFMLVRKKKIRIIGETRYLLYLVLLIIFSTAINSIIHIDIISIDNITGIIYFLVIFLWYALIYNENFNKKEIKFLIINYLIVSSICSIQTIMMSLSGVGGKIAITNLIGTLTDENHSSAIISMAPIYCFIIILNSKKKITFSNLIYFVIFTINILGVCLTGSRASLMGDILSIFILFLIYFFRDFNIKKVIAIIFMSCIGIFLIYYIIGIMPEWIFNRYFGNSYADKSNMNRISIWLNAVDGILTQPLLGYGMGTFANLTGNKYGWLKSVPAHETFLDIALYSGILGLIVFLIFLYKIFSKFVFKKELKMYLPVIINILFISIIIGAEKTIFLWNNILILKLISNYTLNNNELNYMEVKNE